MAWLPNLMPCNTPITQRGPLTSEVIERYFNDILTLFGDPVPILLDDFSRCDPKLVNVELQELIAAFPADTMQSYVFEGAKAACYESDLERAAHKPGV